MVSMKRCVRSLVLLMAVGTAIACGSEDDNSGTPAGGAGGLGGTPSGGVGGTGVTGGTGAVGGAAGMPSGGVGGVAGMSGGVGGALTGGVGGAVTGGVGGADPDGGVVVPDAGGDGDGDGTCCTGGDCLCHGEPPSGPTSELGPFDTDSVDTSAGCIFYPTGADAVPPFAAVAISDGFGGSGGCGFSQTGDWGPLYASWGIVAMIIHTTGGDQPRTRGTKLSAAIEAFKTENTTMSSPLFGKLAGRYGTSGFSMGGGGTTFAAEDDSTLLTNVSIMAWTPSTTGITVPSLYIFGSGDTLAGTMGMASYSSISGSVPKMAVTVSSGHAGQPGAGGGASGEAGLAFQKVFLEGDERWIPILKMIDADESANLP